MVISDSPMLLTEAFGGGATTFGRAELFSTAQPIIVKTMAETAMPASQPDVSTLLSGASPLRVSKMANTMRIAMAPTYTKIFCEADKLGTELQIQCGNAGKCDCQRQRAMHKIAQTHDRGSGQQSHNRSDDESDSHVIQRIGKCVCQVFDFSSARDRARKIRANHHPATDQSQRCQSTVM